MFQITSKIDDAPYQKFYKFYSHAIDEGQINPEAIVISSYDPVAREVDSRFVNLKYIINNQWVFFSNLNSPKAIQFQLHSQVSALFYWPVINLQIRMKAEVKEIDPMLSDKHFASRSIEKNTLALISNQSKEISSYDDLVKKYTDSLSSNDVINCRPSHWGGFSFQPYYFEFWKGQKFRLNKRESFELEDNKWLKKILQP